jgi:ribosomal protein S18 acetylase RimI-like enzyme
MQAFARRNGSFGMYAVASARYQRVAFDSRASDRRRARASAPAGRARARRLGVVPGGGDQRDSGFAPVALATDLDRAVATVTAAFANDPVWNWAFPDSDELDLWWRLLVEHAFRNSWISMLGDYEAISVWIPPGANELSDAEEQRIAPLLRKLAGSRAPHVAQLLDRFDAAHPKREPHHYLSVLATHPACRGRGVGMRLVADKLARIDAEAMPAYLESSNPANHARYERAGFERIGSFATPDGSHTLATMWREPR